MITLVAEHFVNKGQMESAKKIFQTVSESVKKAPGFVSRQILVSQKDPSLVTTITSFQSQEAFDKWRQTIKLSEADLKKAFGKINSVPYNVRDKV